MNEKHTSKSFDQDLQETSELFLQMGYQVVEQVAKAVQALMDSDETLAKQVIENDTEIDQYERKLDERILLLVAKRQPTANDLRFVMAMSKGVVDLERIGDEASKIALMARKIILMGQPPKGYSDVQNLSNQVRLMVHQVLDAFAQLNAKQAFNVIKNDEIINREYQLAMHALMNDIIKHQHDIPQVINIMWVLRALERIGDHAGNLAELVIYCRSGQDVKHTDFSVVEQAVNSVEK